MELKSVKAKKSLGQNFLADSSILAAIASAVVHDPHETIIEIGPGHGELTRELLKVATRVIAIEKDRELIPVLTKEFAPLIREGRFTLIEGDALEELPKLARGTYSIAGNIPYYLTGHLLRIVGELNQKPRVSVFTLQREVARRAAAKPPHMNLLAATVQVWADISILRTIPRTAFRPVPKVDSAVIQLITKVAPVPEAYYRTAKMLFAHPRKTIFNNLREVPNASEKLASLGLNPNARPQTLGIEDIERLTAAIEVY